MIHEGALARIDTKMNLFPNAAAQGVVLWPSGVGIAPSKPSLIAVIGDQIDIGAAIAARREEQHIGPAIPVARAAQRMLGPVRLMFGGEAGVEILAGADLDAVITVVLHTDVAGHALPASQWPRQVGEGE